MSDQRISWRRIASWSAALAVAGTACADTTPVTGTDSGVQVQTVPSAPVSVSASPGIARATVTWTAPTRNGGSAIKSYSVTSAPGGVTVVVDGAVDSTTVSDLTAGTSYTFTVVATNNTGSSAASLPSNAVVPTAPIIVPPASGSGRWVTGYYVGYLRDAYPETSVDFSVMTHIIVGAIEATSTGGVKTDFFIDDVNGPVMAKTLSARAHAAGRKAILMLGGDGFRDNLVASTTSAYRATFVANLLSTLDALGYDGLDVDWEPIEESDKPQVLQLLQALRAARPGIVLTFPVSWINPNIDVVDPWNVQLATLVDQMNLMTYDMADAWEGWISWHFGALTGRGPSNPSDVESSIASYTAVGIPAAKLGVGIGFFGSCWRGVSGPRQAITAGVSTGNSDNEMSYSKIMSEYFVASAYRYDSTAQVPYLTFAAAHGPQGCNFISYEDETSIAAKGAFVLAQRLGGLMIWNIQEGHLATAALGRQDPLMAAAHRSIFGGP